jgi:EpsI family protein
MFARTLVLTAALVVTSGYLTWAGGAEPTPSRSQLTDFPSQIGPWSGRTAPAFTPEVLASLAVDDHLNRYYVNADRFAHIYIGYYGSQREGASIHSPLNCLPGAGWLPVSNAHIDIPIASAVAGNPPRSIMVNRYVIQKGLDKQLVLYWYQSHGRVIPSEYWSKAYLVLDSVRLNRTDAALVRVITPYRDADASPEVAAERTVVEFVEAVFPLLDGFLPL